MGHTHPVNDTDTHFIIDPITRAITNAESKKTLLMQNDHNSERFSFEIDRYVEDHDMTLCNQVEIHFSNVDSNRKNTSLGVYEVDDVTLTEDETKLIFTWLVSENATLYSGSLNFLIMFSCIENGQRVYRWNTGVNNSISIAKGMYNGEAIAESYPDILVQWKEELFAAVYGYKTVSIGPTEPETYPYLWFDTSDGYGQNIGVITVKDADGIITIVRPYTQIDDVVGLVDALNDVVSKVDAFGETVNSLGETVDSLGETVDSLGETLNSHTHLPSDIGAIYGTKIAVLLSVDGWGDTLTQTVSVPGVSAVNDILVAAYPTDTMVWAEAGVLATAQTSDSVTFTCVTVPETDVTANIIILNGVVSA